MSGENRRERHDDELTEKAEEQAAAAERATETDDSSIDPDEALEAEEEPEPHDTWVEPIVTQP